MRTVRLVVVGARSFWVDHLWVDLAVAAVVVALHGGLLLVWPVLDVLGAALPVDRRGVYSASAVVVSLLGSLSSLAIGQLSSAGGTRAKALRDQGGPALARTWQSVFRASLLAAVVAILALLLDPSIHVTSTVPVVIRWVFEFMLLFAVVKFLRLSTLFYEVQSIKAVSEADPEDERQRAEAPQLSSRWQRSAA